MCGDMYSALAFHRINGIFAKVFKNPLKELWVDLNFYFWGGVGYLNLL